MNAPARFKAPLPAPTMRNLLALRKEALEGQIAERLRAARTSSTTADVKSLSAILRAVKAQLKAVGNGVERR